MVVIGSGVTGVSVVHHLIEGLGKKGGEKGEHVLMLEAREVCWGATGRVSRVFFLYDWILDGR